MDYIPPCDLTGDLSFAAPAKIRVLLTPAVVPSSAGGPSSSAYSQRDFEKWADHVRSFASIKLSDLPRSTAGRAGPPQDSPLYRKGEIHLSFVTSYDPAHAFLAPFNLHRQVLGVIGIATVPRAASGNHASAVSPGGAGAGASTCNGHASSSSTADYGKLHHTPHALRNQHPGAVIHRVFAFDTSDAEQDAEGDADLGSGEALQGNDEDEDNLGELSKCGDTDDDGYDPEDEVEKANMKALQEQAAATGYGAGSGGFGSQAAEGLIVIPAMRKDQKDVKFYLRQLVTDFVCSLLDGLDSVVAGLKGSPLETPRETLDVGLEVSVANGSSSAGGTLPGANMDGGRSHTWELGAAASRASSLFSFGSSSSGPLSLGGAHANGIGGGQQPDVLSSFSSGMAGASSSAKSKTLKKVIDSTRGSAGSSSSNNSKRVQSMGGSGPTGEGRHTKVLADYCLLAGDLWSAISYYDLAMKWMGKERCLAGGQDAVWFASALEGWAVTKALMARLGKSVSERAPPSALTSTKDKEKKEKEKEKDGTAELPYEDLPWESIAEAYTVAIQIYAKCLAPLSVLMAEPARSVHNETPRDFTHPYIHANACVQYARFLLAVWSCRGWNGECFDQLIYGGVPLSLRAPLQGADRDDALLTPATFTIWSNDSGVRRSEIAAAASQALTLSVAALKPRDQVAILSSMTSVFGCIGFVRRETYLLRQLQNSVLAWLASALLAHGRQRPQAKETLRIRLGEVAPGMAVVWHSSPAQQHARSDFDAILMIAVQICETYGINVNREPVSGIPDTHVLAKARRARMHTSYGNPLLAGRAAPRHARAKRLSAVVGAEEEEGESRPQKASVRPADAQGEFGWIEQQIMLLKDTIGVAETLEDRLSMAFFGALLLRDYYQFLAAEEQWRLAQGLLRIWSNEKPPPGISVSYWGPAEPIARFEMLALSPPRAVQEQSYKALNPSVKAKDESVAGLSNPFFWNPLKGSFSSKTATLVQDELAEFAVTLYNPLEIALEFSSVKLSTSGCKFEAIASEVVVPPTSFHTLVLAGKPLETGSLTVRGVYLRLNGCKEQEFVMCQVDDNNEKRWIAWHADQDDRRTRLKTLGLEARMSINVQPEEEPKSKKSKYSLEHFIQCRVILNQPILEIESTSLVDGRLQIYEGETAELCVTLRNPSNLPVDYGVFSFSDTLSAAAQAALAEGGLHPSTVHALEWSLIKQPVLSREGVPKDFLIAAGESVPFLIKVLGKSGCSAATIELDYAHINGLGRGRSVTDEKKNWFTRKLALQFPVDVLKVVQPQSFHIRLLQVNDLTALMASNGIYTPSTAEETSALGDALVRAADEASGQQVCLVSMDVRNVHTHELELELRFSTDEHGKHVALKRVVNAGSSVRLAIPVDQIHLTEEKESAPIPTRSSRQFTVAREKLSEEETRRALVKFWHKEYIYERLQCFWTDMRTGQSGELAIRGQELTDVQLETLRRPALSLVLQVAQSSSGRAGQCRADVKDVEVEQFVNVSAKVTNRSGRPLKLLYRLTPLESASLDPNGAALAPDAQPLDGLVHPTDPVLSQVLLASGTLAAAVQPWPLPDGATATIDKSICFLAQGMYAFVAAVEEAPRFGQPVPPQQQGSSEAAASLKTSERLACISQNRLEVRAVRSCPP
ncbi:hypothetical protein K437DRAFT_256391 [Tilletiaria anomala UBC 951]|uniref:Trs120-domain-containing protein n=1 Tax=Tilletiaria anomala (strain ATCC 24038 / CBS 436.72 / UBC 951) TaxID=1037660 RepID=A0A066VWX1_TILAU|nr:uncharacterized protein K437DRAFT_256391 [Tilletiaria anomala UBC 951]KDN45976.1 hypothetical protein K437DRAFT_256391 [Tilletiaria anomala UBC 951]